MDRGSLNTKVPFRPGHVVAQGEGSAPDARHIDPHVDPIAVPDRQPVIRFRMRDRDEVFGAGEKMGAVDSLGFPEFLVRLMAGIVDPAEEEYATRVDILESNREFAREAHAGAPTIPT
jgi:hypothetical protein